MRLTLRTLLAYLDNILDPKDQEDLAQRVAASDVANDLLHRTRDASRRLRLPAPSVEASGPYSDANTVAEYLDNVLPPDDITQFERRCLDLETFPDADSYLAEAVSCHHVLTMVLAQRAEIDPDSKQRMYALAQQAQAASATPTAEPPQAQVRPTPDMSTISEVPDYLRASGRPLFSRLLPAIAALLLLGLAIYFMYGFGGGNTKKETADAQANSVVDPPTEDTLVTPGDAIPDGGDPEGSETPKPDAPEIPPIETPAESHTQTPILPPVEPPVVPSPEPEEPVGPDMTEEAETPDPTVSDPLTSITADPPTTMPDVLEPDIPGVIPPGTPETTLTPSEDAAPGESPESLVPAEPAPPKRSGLVNTAQQVLLRYSEEAGGWLRLERRAEVMPSDRLLSLPTYRPTIEFDNRVALDFHGGTRVDVDTMTESVPGVTVVYGRVMLTNKGQATAELNLKIGEQSGQLVLAPGVSLAVSVEWEFEPGADPREVAAPLVAKCYAPLGDVTYEGPGFSVHAEQSGMWTMSDTEVSPVAPYDEDPIWITDPDSMLSRVELLASSRLESELGMGEPVWSQLPGIAQSSRQEVRTLASIVGVHIGQFESIIQGLRDEEQRIWWSDEIEALRFAMSSSPDLAQAVHDELDRQHREELATELYEMLCGYNLEQVGATPDQWRVGAMRKLIDRLESDLLEYRVLANYNLEQITKRLRAFHPIGTSGTREREIRVLRGRLKEDTLRPAGLLED